MVVARPSEIVSALVNVIVNAVDAMPDGGTIVVRTRAADDGARVEVVDDGPGMPSDVANRVFEPFFTTKSEEGTGLGLAMVRRCAERHGGSVSLDTAPGTGTTISLWFPPSKTTDSPARDEGSVPRASEPARILVVEDDPLSRAVTSEILSEEGHDVTAVATGTEALNALGSAERSYDLVITDLGLPDMSGLELVRRLREALPTMGIIALSGRSTDESDVSSLLEGSRMAFVRKPLDIDLLVETIACVR